MILQENLFVRQLVEGEDGKSFSAIIEYEGLFYYFRDVQPEDDETVSYELGVGFDSGSGVQPIEVTEEHEAIADELLQVGVKLGDVGLTNAV